jgi:hypothetical protein
MASILAPKTCYCCLIISYFFVSPSRQILGLYLNAENDVRIDRREIGVENADWINLARDRNP